MPTQIVPAWIVTITGPKSYPVELEDGKIWRRHIDQLQGQLGHSVLRKPEEEPALTTKTPINTEQNTSDQASLH